MKLSLATTLILGAATANIAQGASPKTLMQHVRRRLSNNGRRLDDGADITGDYNIAFNSCKSVSTYNEDLINDYSNYAQEKQVTSQKAYIVFDVTPKNGGYSSYYTSTSQQYMTDVQGYIESLLEYNPQQAEAEEGEEEQEGENNNVDDEALEWLKGHTECQEIEDATIFGDQPVYSAFSCNSDGTGVTLGTFLDDECTLETNLVSGAYFMQSEEDLEYFYNSKDYLEAIFTEQLDCANYEEEQDNNGDNEANEFCQNLFDGDMVISLSDCGAYYDQDQADQEEDQDQADQEEDEYDNSWYTFDISEEDADNVYAICTVVQNMTSVGVSGNQYTDGNEVFDFESYKTSTASKTSSSNANSGAIVGGVIGGLVAVVAIAVAAVYYSTTKAADSKKTPLILEANDKKQAVV